MAAVGAFVADPSLITFLIGDGFAIDLHDAVSASPFAPGDLANPDAKPASKRAALRRAILSARPVKSKPKSVGCKEEL